MGLVFNPFTGTFDFTGSGGGGGGTISGTIADTQIAFGTAADTIGGSADLTWDGATLSLLGVTTLGSSGTLTSTSFFDPFVSGEAPINLVTSIYASDVVTQAEGFTFQTIASAFGAVSPLTLYGLVNTVTLHHDGGTLPLAAGIYTNIHSDAASDTDTIYGSYLRASSGSGVGTTTSVYGEYLQVANANAGTLPNAYGTYYELKTFDGPMTTAIAMYTVAMGGEATNPYPFWADEQGVYRIKADNTYNSVYQAITALYNPQVSKYTPGAADYERVVQYWDSNVATYGTEAGGTGTQRILNLVGSVVEANGVPITTSTTGLLPSLLLMGG